MILDRLENAHLYENLSASFRAGLEFLRRPDLPELAVGKYPIQGEAVFAVVQEYTAKPVEEGKYEAHRKYADIQYIVGGRELIGCTNVDGLEPLDDYDEERDIQFFAGTGDLFKIEAGMFAVFFPHDAHMPSLAVQAGEQVMKVVIKVAV